MKATFPGRFESFADMKPGDVFTFRDAKEKRQLGMKAHYHVGLRDQAVRFFEAEGDKSASVVVSLSAGFTHEHTLLVLDGVEISPTDRYDYVGVIELDDRPVEAGWLGLGNDGAFISCVLQAGVPNRLAYVDLAKGVLLDKLPSAVWFRSWRIHLPKPPETETIFKMGK